MNPSRCVLLCVLAFLGAAPGAQKAVAEPRLRPESGMHVGPIQQLAVDRAGRYLVTSASGEPLRLWDPLSGTAVQTLHLPGELDYRSGPAIALSPDGTTLAVAQSALRFTGSSPPESILLLLWHKRQVVRRLSGLAGVVLLAFSPDGSRLAVAQRQEGVRLFAVATGEELGRDSDYGGPCSGLDFSPDGKLATSAADGVLRLYDSSFQLVRKVAVASAGSLAAVRFAPDGAKLAVGYSGTPQVEVYSAADLSLLYHPTTAGVQDGDLRLVAWSLSGSLLYAAGSWRTAEGYPIRRWTLAGQGSVTELPADAQQLTALLPLPQDALAFASLGPAWGTLTAGGSRAQLHRSEVPTFVANMLRVDRTGSRVQFCYTSPGTPAGRELRAAFSVLEHTLTPDGTTDSPSPDRAPAPLPVSVPAGTVVARLSGDGRLVVAALRDGTLRWLSAADGRELLALLPQVDGKRWIAWTPSGYYDASVDGEGLLGWEAARGPELLADFFPMGLFRARLYRPDVTARTLFTRDEGQSLAAANAEAGWERPEVPISRLLPPVVTILDPIDGALVKSSALTVRVAVRSPSEEPITAVSVRVQGRLLQTREVRGLVLVSTAPQPSDPQAVVYELHVTIPQENCTLAILAETALARSDPGLLRLRWAGVQASAVSPVDLFVFAVGVSRYREARLRLEYPAKDAQDLAAAFKSQEGKRYRHVELRVLTDEKSTRASILDGLAWLRQKTEPEDVAVFFLAGHGVNDASGGTYYYLPYDSDPSAPADSMVDSLQVQSFLGSIRGKILLFIDTCHSGSVLGPRRGQGGLAGSRFVNDLASVDTGVVVYAASQGGEASRESLRWRNGAFTKALVEGLHGQADYGRRGQITVSSLEHYISNRVKELTHEEQTPTTAKPSTVPDFLIATVAPSIPLYKKWWVWTLAGLAVAGGAAIGVGIIARGPDTSGLPALRPFAN